VGTATNTSSFRVKLAVCLVAFSLVGLAVGVVLSLSITPFQPGFRKTEELKIKSHTLGDNNAYIDLSVKNTGISALSLASAQVNDAVATSNITSSGYTLQPGSSAVVRITQSFASGVKYEFAVISATANKYTYIATAP
jgi:hypothetical protein